jgi:prepilin-type N-terminal cleavage/methylation domain-containing protein
MYICLPHRTNQSTKTSRGFTLTEIAVVMGVIGLVIGGIWGAATAVSSNNAVNAAVLDLEIIADNYQKLFSYQGIKFGTGPGDTTWYQLTCNGIVGGAFPAEMIRPGTTCAAIPASPPYPTPTDASGNPLFPTTPFGGSSAVYVFGFEASQGIIIVFWNLTQTQCVQFASQVVGIPDLIWENINDSYSNDRTLPPRGTDAPYTLSDINTLCISGSTGYSNSVAVMYPAR